MMKMKFLADMCISMRIVEWLRAQNHDVVHLRDEGLYNISDTEVFNKAVNEDRIILTFDLDFGEIIAFSKESLVSIILFRLRNTRSSFVLNRLDKVINESENIFTKKGTIVVIEDTRYRIRKLPIHP